MTVQCTNWHHRLLYSATVFNIWSISPKIKKRISKHLWINETNICMIYIICNNNTIHISHMSLQMVPVYRCIYTAENWHGTQKWRFGRWVSFSIGWFLGSMLIFRGLLLDFQKSFWNKPGALASFQAGAKIGLKEKVSGKVWAAAVEHIHWMPGNHLQKGEKSYGFHVPVICSASLIN